MVHCSHATSHSAPQSCGRYGGSWPRARQELLRLDHALVCPARSVLSQLARFLQPPPHAPQPPAVHHSLVVAIRVKRQVIAVLCVRYE